MPSLIPGYEYDIFISYRQKDNKGDRWVSEFVEALKTELESTFKEEISVYFDINPHDGLLETHDIDASLKEKLKCLVFIPIISRTYCDPKSFAWEHEFKAFVELASNDQFGLKVKLLNSNVASRVLPIRIYDLDNTDIKLCESVFGGVIRSVDFIYKSAGINRPLRSKEEKPQENLNNTLYRDQINKVANSIKEIITAIGQHKQKPEEIQKEVTKPTSVPRKSNKTAIIAGSVLVLALIILGLFFVPKLFKPEIELEKSIAVLPFTNLSNDPEQEYFSDGVVEAILNHLFKIGELKVISSTSTKRYKNTDLSIKEIARELGVSSILEGSVQKIGNNVRITTQLIDASTDMHLWSEIYDRNISDLLSIQSEVAQNVAKELKATLTSEEKQQIEKRETNNPEAYNLYLQGFFHIKKRTNEGYKKSIEYFEKAVAMDPDYALAYAGLADAYFLLAWYNQMAKPEAYAKSKEYVKQALGIDKNLAEAHTVLGTLLCWDEWKWEEARKELQLAVELNPNFISAHSYYAELLEILRENSDARKQMNIALELDPFFPMMRYLSARLYYNEGKYNESLDEVRKRREITSDSTFDWLEFLNYISLGEDLKAVEALEKLFLNSSDTLTAKSAIFLKDVYNKAGIKGLRNWLIEIELKRSTPSTWNLATRYAAVGKKEEALYWLEKYFENRTSALPRINNNPELEILRSEPRFQAMIKKLGLSDYQTPK
jgi:TolB-like protein